MERRKRYCKKPAQFIIAVQLDLDTDGFRYQKWGAEQTCKPGDWLVWNPGADDTYTIDRETFVDTYNKVADGRYVKTAIVWAEIAQEAGTISTKEGTSDYEAGDYICSNDEAGTDSYTVPRASFEDMYELVPVDDH